jgi:hypothetical protein
VLTFVSCVCGTVCVRARSCLKVVYDGEQPGYYLEGPIGPSKGTSLKCFLQLQYPTQKQTWLALHAHTDVYMRISVTYTPLVCRQGSSMANRHIICYGHRHSSDHPYTELA